MKHQIHLICLFCIFSLLGCKEGTIVYDVEFPRADSDEAQGGGGNSGSICRVPEEAGASNVAFFSDESQQLLMSLAGFNQLSLDAEANIYVARATTINPGAHLVMYDRLGRHQWSRQLGLPKNVESFGVSTGLYGNAYTHLTQSNGETDFGDLDVMLAKYDSTGAKRWVRTLASPADDMVLGSQVGQKGNLFATGFTFGNLENFVSSHTSCAPTFPSDNSIYNYNTSTHTLTVPEDLDNSAEDPSSDQSFKVTLASGASYAVSSGDTSLVTVSAVDSGTGEFTLSLKKNQHGSTTITASSSCGNQSFTLNVTSINDKIGDRKNNQVYFTNAGDNFTCESKSACFTSDNDTLDGGFVSDNWSIKTAPLNGAAGITLSGEWWYQPSSVFNGREYFTVEVYDNDGFANEREICVASVADSSGPILRCQGQIGSATDNLTEQNKMNEDGGTETGTLYFHDKNNQPLSYQIINLPDNGTTGYYKTTNATAWLTNQADNVTNWNYLPDENYNGTETFVIRFSDSVGDINHVEIKVKVKAVNDKPVPTDISASVTENSSSSYSVSLSATDAEDSTITKFIQNNDPLYGTISSFNSPSGTFTFTPFDNLSVGSYTTTFTYHAKDSNNDQSATPATVTLTVVGANDQPVADNKTPGAITEGSPSNINLSATDIDQDDIIVHYTITSLSQHGTLTDNATGTSLNVGSLTSAVVTFAPFDNLSASFSQNTSFTYTATDNSSAVNNTSENATVSLTVNGSNNSPVASSIVDNVTEDNPGTVTLSASDVDFGDGLTYSQPLTPQHGSITNFNSSTGAFTFTPFDNLSHNTSYTETLSYTAQDDSSTGTANSNTATVTLTLTGVNDVPNASAGSATVTEGSPDNITLSASDPDSGDTLSYLLLSQPSYGNVTITGNQILFTPFDNLSATDSFSDSFIFQVTDAQGAADNATISLTVNGANDPPNADSVSSNVTEDTPGAIMLVASDQDNGDSLTYNLLTTPQYGTVSNFNSSTGTFTFTPQDSLSHGLIYTDTFNYQVQDSQGQNSGSATVTLTLTGTNDAPVANSLNSGTTINWGQSGNFTLNGSDIDGDNFTFSIISQPQYSQISNFDNSTGLLSLTPNNNLTHGSSTADNLTFKVTDTNNASSNVASVSFTVLGPVCSAGLENNSLKDSTTVRNHADLFLAKYDRNGNQLWSRQIGTSADDVSFAVSADDQGNTYVTGFTQGVLYGDSSAGGLDVFLIKFGSQGRELWRRQFGSIGDETGLSITTDEEGSVYLTGQTDGNLGEFTNEGGKDLFVAKYDSLGSQQWLTQWGTAGDDLGIKISVDVLGRLNLLSLIATNNNSVESQPYFSRFDPKTGKQLWNLPMETPNSENQVLALDYTGNAFLIDTPVMMSNAFDSSLVLEYRPDSHP